MGMDVFDCLIFYWVDCFFLIKYVFDWIGISVFCFGCYLFVYEVFYVLVIGLVWINI